MTAKEKELIQAVVTLPPKIQDRILDIITGAAVAAEATGGGIFGHDN